MTWTPPTRTAARDELVGMRALTLVQPWATLIALGVKTIETRSWRTSHRGPLAIHAGARVDLEAVDRLRDLLPDEYALPPYPFPSRCLVALVDLSEIEPADLIRRQLVGALSPSPSIRSGELRSGDFGPKRWAWRLDSTRRLEPTVPIRTGALGVWTITPAHLEVDR